MEVTYFLARFWGLLMGIVCLAYLIRGPKFAMHMFKMADDKSFMTLSGFLALILGLITVMLHNIWDSEWYVVVTLIGWISLIKGIVRIAFPESMSGIAPMFSKKPAVTTTLLVIAVVVSVWLVWMTQ